MPSFLFRCFALVLPHLRTLAQEKKVRLKIALLVSIIVGSRIIFPRANNAPAKKKNSREAICSCQSALSGF